ncbi:GNAT family N-acetyltransferase [Staphylococcus gallinarum]|nr:GNAT family N-acetyltransferase [Staphylococcus gallinarum]MCD8820840.1 GNAT family N-acetyltransferase [Staphylococcus gallinarum]PTL07384.1 GNAT family N-acetyltransferase [Staphylococcus gallinarum]PTL09571.1 GNAT family N-acetyltransferase [Staphylococcus gallinarum]RIL33317.1 GNAT family N-acetyltransferase [Staphylococcus gallinarum]RIO76226.1 GNAT family N-acetyltransferase [Staphylococcus gallinarum]
MIRCVCLVIEQDDQLLLVQARHREKYYFPGGKIDPGELHIQALQREIQEELQMTLAETDIEYMTTIIGDAYPQPNTQTELNLFRLIADVDWEKLNPAQEITDMQWVDVTARDQIAPAVLKWIDYSRESNNVVAAPSGIALIPYNEDLYEAVEGITLKAEDNQFTKTPIENIRLAQMDSERHPTLVFNAQQQCVGFFTLHEGDGVRPYSSNVAESIFFRSFSIDVRYRGMGYAKCIIEELERYVLSYFPHVKSIYLTVNNDNEIARKLYAACNYEHVGDSLLEGRPVYNMMKKIV